MDFQNNFKEYLSKKESQNEELSQKETKDLQEAIDKSKVSAEEEQQLREYDRQADEIQKFYKPSASTESPGEEPTKEKPFTPKQWSKGAKSPVRGPVRLRLTFQDLIDVTGVQLDIVYHKPVFERPIDMSGSVEQRAASLFIYYTDMGRKRAAVARESLHMAPFGKPIFPTESNGSKSQSPDDPDSTQDPLALPPVKDVYVSRAGRQIKRKIYTEELEVDSDSDAAYLIKKNRADDSETKITLDTPFIPEEMGVKSTKTKQDTPRRPTSLGLKKYSSRCDAMVEKAIASAEKKRHEQQEMDDFERTLPSLDEVEDESWLEDPVKEEDEVRRRVIPPIPTRGRGRGRKAAAREDSDKKDPKASQKQDSPPDSPVLKRYPNVGKSPDIKSKPKPRSQKFKEYPFNEPSTSTRFQRVPCPICSREFLQSEIVNHASNCGIEEEVGESSGTNRSPIKKIKCELCDREFAMNTEYEAHVKQCIASKVSDL